MYGTESSPEAKGAILDSLYSSGNVDKLIEIAKTEKDPKLRTQAIHRLGAAHRPKSLEALAAMYPSETDKQIKIQILHSFMSQGAAKEVVDVARREKDPELQREAVRMLTSMKSKEATDYLTELLSK